MNIQKNKGQKFPSELEQLMLICLCYWSPPGSPGYFFLTPPLRVLTPLALDFFLSSFPGAFLLGFPLLGLQFKVIDCQSLQ
jgi:hypothetical protein